MSEFRPPRRTGERPEFKLDIDGASLLVAYGQCPLFANPDRPEARGDLLEVVEPVREAGLFKKSRRTIKVHAGRVEGFTLGPASGRTAIAYNVTLKRVG